jgi:hypothetical protein
MSGKDAKAQRKYWETIFAARSRQLDGPVRLAFAKITEVFPEIFETGMLDSCRPLHFIRRLQTIDASAGSTATAGYHRNTDPEGNR